MKSFQLVSPGAFVVQEKPPPVPGPGETLLTVLSCGICRTDAKIWSMGHRDVVLPRILGHEICGVRPDTGERFVVWPGHACGACVPCLGGAENLCDSMKILGFNRDGGFAESVTVRPENLVPVPDDLPDSLACLAEPLACAVNALDQMELQRGATLLIFGAGPVGLLLALAAGSRSLSPVVLDISPERIRFADGFLQRLGRGAIYRDQAGFDAAVNATSATQTLEDGLSFIRPGGCFCLFSGLTDGGSVPASALNQIHYRQVRITGAYGCTRIQMQEAVNLIHAQPDLVLSLVEARIALEKIPDVLPRVLSGTALRYVVMFQ